MKRSFSVSLAVSNSSPLEVLGLVLQGSAARETIKNRIYIGGQMGVNFFKSLHRFTVVYT
jgi:hypothetical protein